MDFKSRRRGTPMISFPRKIRLLLTSRAARAWGSVLLLFLVILALARYPSSPIARGSSQTSAVYNRTLGFQKVFAIGFASRTDKRDALSVASSVSGFDITWSEGVRFKDMELKAIPEMFNSITDHKAFPDTAIACWRAHMNVLQTIVNENIQTALVMEDDNDWDVNLKSQLEEFAKGASALQSRHPRSRSHPSPRGSPYGNSWDTLWLGHCMTGPRDTGIGGDVQEMYVLENDTTVPPVQLRTSWWNNDHIIPEIMSDNTRVIIRAGSGLCLWGHAITLEAARKVLTWLSIEERKPRQIDVAFSQLLEDDELESYSIYPPLMSSHHFAGSRFRDSDIRPFAKDVQHNAFTSDIIFSTMMNLARLVEGEEEVFSQWPEYTEPTRRLNEKYGDQVSTKFIDVNLPAMESYAIRGINMNGILDQDGYHELLMDLRS